MLSKLQSYIRKNLKKLLSCKYMTVISGHLFISASNSQIKSVINSDYNAKQ